MKEYIKQVYEIEYEVDTDAFFEANSLIKKFRSDAINLELEKLIKTTEKSTLDEAEIKCGSIILVSKKTPKEDSHMLEIHESLKSINGRLAYTRLLEPNEVFIVEDEFIEIDNYSIIGASAKDGKTFIRIAGDVYTKENLSFTSKLYTF